ncbi:hypothetical protein H0H93_016967 [Arthromyces matolae]|nr:hypothetical protein H0H93_016967 [Arthromyces matolae]
MNTPDTKHGRVPELTANQKCSEETHGGHTTGGEPQHQEGPKYSRPPVALAYHPSPPNDDSISDYWLQATSKIPVMRNMVEERTATSIAQTEGMFMCTKVFMYVDLSRLSKNGLSNIGAFFKLIWYMLKTHLATKIIVEETKPNMTAARVSRVANVPLLRLQDLLSNVLERTRLRHTLSEK